MVFDIDRYLAQAWKGKILTEEAIKVICLKAKELFIQEDNVTSLRTPISLVGDIHGQFYDLLELFKISGKPPYCNFLFLGDYVDRGHHSVEVITLLLLLKIKYPKRVSLIRGNHETRTTSQQYGFYIECERKLGSVSTWECICDLFDFLPISAVIDNKIFCVHGGLSPQIENLDQINDLNRFQEVPQEGAVIDLMWSDPEKSIQGFGLSPRGAGYLFGKDVVQKFLHTNGMVKMARAHQLCKEGYELMFDDKLATVWSCPKYCYRFDNVASVLEIDEDLEYEFNVFKEAPENAAINAEIEEKEQIVDPMIDNLQFFR